MLTCTSAPCASTRRLPAAMPPCWRPRSPSTYSQTCPIRPSRSLESGDVKLFGKRIGAAEAREPGERGAAGAKSLLEIKDSTKVGYGFYTVDGSGEGLAQTFDALASLIAG